MPSYRKYARIERERRFLLQQFPADAKIQRARYIRDYYIEGTTLRLREQRDESDAPLFKLTQKIPAPDSGAQQGWITSLYLKEEEFRLLVQLPSAKLDKIRYSVPPFGIDVFEGPLQGLILAEAEFDSASSADALKLPAFIQREVTADPRFAGGELVRTSSEGLRQLLDR